METPRNHGLDVVRAMAITMVLGGHVINVFAEDFPGLTSVHVAIASCGVDIFFALSGFLIGGILLRDLTANPSPRTLVRFWTRRWFRTLPNYYLWLFINVFAAAAQHLPLPPIGRYYLFLQNVDTPTLWFFSISWSLSIEEWFYVLLPILLFAFWNATRSWRVSSLAALLLLGGISFFGRAHAALQVDPWEWDLIRKPMVYRFDALMAGVLLAHLQTFAPRTWPRLVQRGPVISAALFATYFSAFKILDIEHSLFAKTVLILVAPVATLFALPALAEIRHGGKWRVPVRALSDWSYSLYLIHQLIYLFLAVDFHGVSQLSIAMKTVFALTWMATTFVVSALNYRVFERPMKNLRELIFVERDLPGIERAGNRSPVG